MGVSTTLNRQHSWSQWCPSSLEGLHYILSSNYCVLIVSMYIGLLQQLTMVVESLILNQGHFRYGGGIRDSKYHYARNARRKFLIPVATPINLIIYVRTYTVRNYLFQPRPTIW